MEPGNSEYDRIAAQIPEIAPGSRKCIATFLMCAEIDAEATAATGKVAPEILDAATQANGFQLKSAPVVAAGFDVYRDRPYVRLTVPRSSDMPVMESVTVPVTQQHVDEYPKEWAEFQKRMQDTRHDVRICHGITPAAIETLRGLGIFTLEALADSKVSLPAFIAEHQKFARRYLAVVNGEKMRYRLVDGKFEVVA